MAYLINTRQLMAELAVAEPILKKEADRVMKTTFFDPAVAQLKEDFFDSPVTQEIAAGVDARNVSNTLEGSFRDKEGDSHANLTSFIGFDQSPAEVLAPIVQRLDPRHEDGPKLIYKNMDRNRLAFRYEVSAPNESAIYDATPLPWTDGGDISWAKRIEQGIAGIGHFLNVKRGRSGGGVQIEGDVPDRAGRFRPVPYLSQMFNNFLRRVVNRADNGRRPQADKVYEVSQ